MKIHFIHPFSLEKKYGREINETFAMIPEEDWLCIMDWDCMMLSHETPALIYKYVEQFPDTGMFLATSNRSGSLEQRPKVDGKDLFDFNANILYHHKICNDIAKRPIEVKSVDRNISGYLMLVSKKTWNEIKFSDELNVLHVDRDYADKILASGKQIFVMQSVYVWHSYRIWKDTKDKTHLL